MAYDTVLQADEIKLEKEKALLIDMIKSNFPKEYFQWLDYISSINLTPSSSNNTNYNIVTTAEGAFYAQ